jgi:hypothetical protein
MLSEEKKMFKKPARVLILILGLAICFFASCANAPAVRGSDTIIADKGSVEGTTLPAWVQVALAGDARNLEKLSEFLGTVVVVTSFDSAKLEEAQATAGKMRPETEIGYFLSLRVKEILKNAKVPAQDYKTFTEYQGAFEDKVAEAIYPDFKTGPDWWVKLQPSDNANNLGKQKFRVIKLWTIDKKILMKKFDSILADLQEKAPASPANVRAKNLIEDTLQADFFGI